MGRGKIGYMPSTESLLRLWGRVRPLATILTMVVIGFAIVWYTARNWALMTEYPWQLDWVWVPAAIVTMSVFYLGLAVGWRRAVGWHGHACVAMWTMSPNMLARARACHPAQPNIAALRTPRRAGPAQQAKTHWLARSACSTTTSRISWAESPPCPRNSFLRPGAGWWSSLRNERPEVLVQ